MSSSWTMANITNPTQTPSSEVDSYEDFNPYDYEEFSDSDEERDYHQSRLESLERYQKEELRLRNEELRLRNEELSPIMKKFYDNAIENAIRMEKTGPTSAQIESHLIAFVCPSIIPFLDHPYRIETYEEHMALLKFHRCSEEEQQRLKEEYRRTMLNHK